jgi:hypothetical protein
MDNGNGTATVGGIPTMTGTFGITITAQNSVSPNAMQTFTLTVDQAPAITSTNSATFVLDASASFTVTSSGFPTPVISESGTLPSGVMFVANPNGTGTLSGTPTMDGTFPIMFTAANGVGSPAMQSFTLTVSGPLVELAPASIDFGNAYIHSARKRNVSLKNAGNAPLTISDVSLSLGAGTSPGNFEIDNLCPATLGARKSCVIVVLFLANEVGSLSATLNVADNASPSPQQVSMSATVINPIASFNPAMLSFRSVEIGHSATQTTPSPTPAPPPWTSRASASRERIWATFKPAPAPVRLRPAQIA